jgi:hypothetical protein
MLESPPTKGVGGSSAILLAAVREEFKENEDLPNTTNPDDWAKIAGKKGERVVSVKSLVRQTSPQERTVGGYHRSILGT